MSTLTIECPEILCRSLNGDANLVGRQVCIAAAAKLYELGRLSSGRAAELAGMSRLAFLAILPEYKVSLYNESPDALIEDLNVARQALPHDHQ